MAMLSCSAMYILMYMMVDRFSNIYNNLNQAYMAGLMTMPMVMIELLVMGGMYKNKKLNTLLMVISAVSLFILFLLVRNQVGISNRQFLKSMIPHHAGALLMCEKAKLNDEEVKELCKKILISQQSEIDQMKEMLEIK